MLAVALAFAGCSDFLDSEDNSNIAGDNFYQTEDDFRAATAPLYNKVWFFTSSLLDELPLIPLIILLVCCTILYNEPQAETNGPVNPVSVKSAKG